MGHRADNAPARRFRASLPAGQASGAAMAGKVTVLVGTTKGVFLIDGGTGRSGWKVRGPFCNGWPINHVVGDPASGTIWAGGGGDWHGAGI